MLAASSSDEESADLDLLTNSNSPENFKVQPTSKPLVHTIKIRFYIFSFLNDIKQTNGVVHIFVYLQANMFQRKVCGPNLQYQHTNFNLYYKILK
jgi:hypothetical protein